MDEWDLSKTEKEVLFRKEGGERYEGIGSEISKLTELQPGNDMTLWT